MSIKMKNGYFSLYFNLKDSEKKEYHNFCNKNFGIPSYYKTKNGIVEPYVDKYKFMYNERLVEPIYTNILFHDVYPSFKAELREKRLKTILSQ